MPLPATVGAMTSAFMDQARATALMQAQGIDALIVVQPENFYYATGANAGFAALWRRAGTAIAVIPADPRVPPAVVIPDAQARSFRMASDIRDVRTHPLWVETEDLAPFLPSERPTEAIVRDAARRAGKEPQHKRPATYDIALALAEVRHILDERALLHGCLGIEMDFIPVNDFESFRHGVPNARFVDSSHIFRQLRMIKGPAEIAFLRQGAALSEAGITASLNAVREGLSASDVAFSYRSGVLEAARHAAAATFESTWDIISVGPQPWGAGASTATVTAGSQLKFDVGCTVGGYQSDIGRTYVFGNGNEHQKRIHGALLEAFHAGLEEFKPGNPISRIHHAAQTKMRELGFESYTRGHFGHGIGANVWHEEWPYIAATESQVLMPGMVFAFETPYYVDGVGGFIIEDHILVTERGPESFNTLAREYAEVG
ncbi:aminopeptidase P family protein [bacterium]|nr:MAG: aminopeptidase P family protein [bacterium]